MNNPLNCSKISRDSSRVYSDKALKGEVLVSYQFRLGTKWKRKNLAEKNENEFSKNILESVYLFPDDAAQLLRHSIVHSARFTEPKDFTFGDWFENDSNPTRWIEVEPLQHIRNYDCLIYSHPKFTESQSKDVATKKEMNINPRERDSYLKLITILSHHLAFKENRGRFVKNDGSPNIDQFAEWLSNRWKEFAPYDSDNMSHSNIRKKLSLASKFFKKPSQVTDKS